LPTLPLAQSEQGDPHSVKFCGVMLVAGPLDLVKA
jgi:hypothetical protein